MPFALPAFSALRVNTLNLEARFTTLLGRYKIITDRGVGSSSSSSVSQNSLQVLIARTNTVVTCATGRDTAVEVFNLLSTELRTVALEGDPEKIKQGTMFLLGALLHRYFRILKKYDEFNSSRVVQTVSFFAHSLLATPASEPTNSALFRAIREVLLGIPQKEKPPASFREKDIEAIDATTIVTCLEVFRDNMKLVDTAKVPRYKKYPHFAKDPNFEPYLQAIIDEHTERARPVLHQYKAVRFVESLINEVDTGHEEVESVITSWCSALMKVQSDFSKLSAEEIKKHLEDFSVPTPIKNKILYLLNTEHINSRLKVLNHTTFLEEMKACNTSIATYTVMGGYALLLQSDIDEKLRACIHQALEVEDNPSRFSKQDMHDGLEYLDLWVENHVESRLDSEFFGGRAKLCTEIVQRRLQLATDIRAESRLGALAAGELDEIASGFVMV